MSKSRPQILGAAIDGQTRCVHYSTVLDVVALKFACCGEFYPCHLCHAQTAGHAATQWPRASRDELAVLCGVCGDLLSIADYLEATDCPSCSATFNPGCKLHSELYFQA